MNSPDGQVVEGVLLVRSLVGDGRETELSYPRRFAVERKKREEGRRKGQRVYSI